MKPFSAFLVIIRTNFGKIIGLFVDSKFESTRGMMTGGYFVNSKLINNIIFYYFLDDQLIKCPWKYSEKAWMESNDEHFLVTAGLEI